MVWFLSQPKTSFTSIIYYIIWMTINNNMLIQSEYMKEFSLSDWAISSLAPPWLSTTTTICSHSLARLLLLYFALHDLLYLSVSVVLLFFLAQLTLLRAVYMICPRYSNRSTAFLYKKRCWTLFWCHYPIVSTLTQFGQLFIQSREKKNNICINTRLNQIKFTLILSIHT